MSPKKARAIRLALDLPRSPKDMTPVQRAHYRQTKVRYAKLPAPARASFLDNVTEIKRQLAAIDERRAEAANQTGILNPSL